MRELKNIEERILDRALYVMGQHRTCNITVRAVAREANVNVSAINYYFRTKDDMVRLVKEFYIENTLAVLSALTNEKYDDEEKLLYAANEIMEYSLRFPGNTVIYAHSLNLAGTDDTSEKIIQLFREIGDRIMHLLRHVVPGDESSLAYKYLIFTSAVNYPTENEKVIGTEGIKLHDRGARIKYIKLLIASLKNI